MSDKNTDPAAAPSQPWYKRRKSKRNAIIILTLLVVLSLLYSFAPTYIARFVIDSQLNKYGIQHSGIETLKINPWSMEIWLGPVEFWSGDIEHGQLGEFGIKLNLLPVFQKHAMVERVLVRGIDIYVARNEENTISLNGIPLNQFFPAEAKTTDAQAEADATPWGTGLGALELQDSRLIYKEKTGGSLTVLIDNLRLGEFISWTPDEAGSFQLKARVNAIELDWSGTARPFAEHITVTADAVTREAGFPKVIEFTGPLGENPMERHDGIYNSVFQHEFTLFKTGRLEGKTTGKLEVIKADFIQDDSYALTVDKAEVDLDTTYIMSEENDLDIEGQISMNIIQTGGKAPRESNFELDKAQVYLDQLHIAVKDDRSTSVSVKPRLNLENGKFNGRIHLSMDALLNILRQLQSLSAGVEVSEEQTGLGDYTGDEVTLPRSTITVAQLNIDSSKFDLSTAAGKVKLEHAVSGEASGLEIASKERHMHIARAKTEISNLQLQSGQGQMSLNLSGNSVLNTIKHKGPFGEGEIESVEMVNEGLKLQVESGDIAVEAGVQAAVQGSRIQLYKFDELPETSLGIGAVRTHIKKGRFAVAQNKMQWQTDMEASIDNFAVSVDKGKVAATKFKRLELRNAMANQNFNISADALTMNDLNVFVTRTYIDDIIATAKLEASDSKEKADKPSEDTVKADAAKTEKPVLQIGRIALLNGAKVRFEDKNVQPPIEVNTIFTSVELRDIDMKNPEKRAQAELLASINEFTNIEINGWATNLGPTANLEIQGKIENLELPSYSPYTAEFGGVHIESGRFSTSTETKAEQGNLDGIINLDVQHLNFKPLSKEDAERLSKRAGFPIQTAVGLLQDSDGRIKLKFPVSGTVTKPGIDISSAITKAIGGTLKTIFPPTMIAGMLSSQETGGGLTFQPVKFKPGSADLDSEARKYVDELVTLLQERPVLSLYVCGATNAEDFFGLTYININKPTKTEIAAQQRLKLIETHRPQLLELAGERTKAVRRYMIKEKGLDAKRVGECRPKFDVEDKGPPRVDVTL